MRAIVLNVPARAKQLQAAIRFRWQQQLQVALDKCCRRVPSQPSRSSTTKPLTIAPARTKVHHLARPQLQQLARHAGLRRIVLGAQEANANDAAKLYDFETGCDGMRPDIAQAASRDCGCEGAASFLFDLKHIALVAVAAGAAAAPAAYLRRMLQKYNEGRAGHTVVGLACLCASTSSSCISKPSLASTAAFGSCAYANLPSAITPPEHQAMRAQRGQLSLADELHGLVIQDLGVAALLLLLLGCLGVPQPFLFLLREQLLPQKQQLTAELRGRYAIRQHKCALLLLLRPRCVPHLLLSSSFAQLVAEKE